MKKKPLPPKPKLLQKKLGLEKMTFADLKVPVDPEYDPKVTIAESHRYVREGLSILGEDYVDMVDRAYRERWIDFAKNIGKSTGGFCSGIYRKNSFILLIAVTFYITFCFKAFKNRCKCA